MTRQAKVLVILAPPVLIASMAGPCPPGIAPHRARVRVGGLETRSIRWTAAAHVLVDARGLRAAAFALGG